jgi:catechol 2,3-dioxygenase-like lactoylglutathione lyase family enzyme
MLGNATVFANLKAADLDAALDFYGGELGLELVWDGDVMPGHREVLFAAGGAIVCLERGEPSGGGQTLVSFALDDVDGAVASLRDRGVVFEEYDLPSLKTENGVATIGSLKAAWFKDPSGNLLAVTSDVEAVKAGSA